MAFVQAPVTADGDPGTAELVQGQIGRPDGPGEDRGVEDGEVEAPVLLGPEEGAGLAGLVLSLGGQVDVDPAGEEALGVPGRLTVTEKDQIGHGSEGSRRDQFRADVEAYHRPADQGSSGS